MTKNTHSLAQQYYFSDFTEEHYELLIKLAKKYYTFETFLTQSKKPHIILRHDVDFSVHRAVRLAEIERKLGIKSTFFFRLHSEFYNLFEKDIYDRVNKIIRFGHGIGLHFEYSFYPKMSRRKFDEKLSLEKKILENIFCIDINVFSFHNPEINNTIKITHNRMAGMINVYGEKITDNYYYCSDSNGFWKYIRLKDLLKEHTQPKIHILIHPEWWQKKPMSPRERVQRCINFRAKRTAEMYDRIVSESGRKNIKTVKK